VIYSDAICAYNDIQAEANQSRLNDIKFKKEIETRLEVSRNTRKQFLEGRQERRDSDTSQSSQSSKNEDVVAAADDGPWYPGKILRRHFAGKLSPRDSEARHPSPRDRSDEAAEEVAAAVWRSVAQELLDFEVC